MKVLGVKQMQQKAFKLLKFLDVQWKGILGSIPSAFILIVYGHSGNGKTEFLLRMAKFFTRFGTVAWLSYEQGHGYDLQLAINRNNMEDVSGSFLIIDPCANKPHHVSYLEDLDNYLSKRNSPQFVFIDSLDYLNWKFEDYLYLKEKFVVKKKKTIVFVSHAKGSEPKSAIGERIKYDGGMGFRVSKFIAYPDKNRFGGNDPYVIWEEKARELNPLFFKPSTKDQPKEAGKTAKKKPEKVKEMAETPAEA